MKSTVTLLFTLLMVGLCSHSMAQNPYVHHSGTGWLQDAYDIIIQEDPSAYASVNYTREGNAQMWDREANDNQGAWGKPVSWIYRLTYTDGAAADIRVRQRGFTKVEADSLAARYGYQMGQLPACLRKGVALINIMKGDALYGGNNWNHSIDITIGKTSELYHRTGNMEEILFHEATHAALDNLYKEGWRNFSSKDPRYISKYAADNPEREDISESFLLTAAMDHRPSRIPSLAAELQSNLPNRMKFLKSLSLEMFPFDNMAEASEGVFDAEAFYRFTCQWLGEGRSLTVTKEGVQLARTANQPGQYWRVEALRDGYYRLTTQSRGRVLSLDVINDEQGNRLQLAPSGAFTGQYWLIEKAEDGFYRLTTAFQGKGKSLDVVNDGVNNQLQLSPTGNYTGQLWKITPIK